uniref:Leucine-rich repeat protein SHOC-2 n=1 Tax=Periophthalmus magnuspinnatus TaxID=409849 RepID=A0A3B3ZCM0_9GOBI
LFLSMEGAVALRESRGVRCHRNVSAPACRVRATSLKMSSRNLKEVPPDVCMLPHLSVLLLNNNHICTLPVELLRLLYLFAMFNPSQITVFFVFVVFSLTKLHCLSLAHNKLENIPAELGHLIELTEVNFTNNCLSTLPQEIYHCKLLTKMYLARNQLSSLPEVSDDTLLCLACVCLVHVHFVALNQGIRALTKLQVLDVAGNKLSMFPAEVHTRKAMTMNEKECVSESSADGDGRWVFSLHNDICEAQDLSL